MHRKGRSASSLLCCRCGCHNLSSSVSSSRPCRHHRRLLIPLFFLGLFSFFYSIVFHHYRTYTNDLWFMKQQQSSSSSNFYFSFDVPQLLSSAISSSTYSNYLNLSNNKDQTAFRTTALHQLPPPRYAYAFLVAGCDPTENPSYRGFLYSIVLSIHTLLKSGSIADFIIMVQMTSRTTTTSSTNNTNAVLPESDLLPFIKLNATMNHDRHGIYIRYIPTPTAHSKTDNFYHAMMTKFIILQWTEYSRILYLDADVLPYCNLDYFFHLSRRGILKPNVILAAGSSPINGGVFLIQPTGDYDQLQQILVKQQIHALNMVRANLPPFDPITGWGHKIEPPHDYWMTVKKTKGYLWDFHAAFADQGLLYYWTKHVKKNVSIIIFDIVEHWTASTNTNTTTVMLESNVSAASIPGLGCHHGTSWTLRKGIPRNPYQDFWHHMAELKPWEMTTIPEDVPTLNQAVDARQAWFHVFRKVYRELNWNNDNNNNNTNSSNQTNITHLFPLGAPTLGRNPSRKHMLAAARLHLNLTRKTRTNPTT